jgi:hypothetical protein
MGGIVGFVGRKPAAAPILDALRRLGYRGYDSAGIAILEHGLHAEGYAAGELKHGPIALIDKDLPVVVIAPTDATFEKTMSNMHEVIAREGRTIPDCGSKRGIARVTGGLGNADPPRHAGVSGAARLRVAVAASCVPHRARPGNRRRSTAPSRQVRDCRMIWPSGWARRRRFDYCLRARR